MPLINIEGQKIANEIKGRNVKYRIKLIVNYLFPEQNELQFKFVFMAKKIIMSIY